MIKGDRILLRAIEYEDIDLLTRWRNDPRLYENFYEHEPLSNAMQKIWFEKFLQKNDDKYWIAESIHDKEPLGTVALLHIDWRSRKAEMGRVLIAPDARRRAGYGKEMCNLALKYAFEHLNLHKIYLEVFQHNTAAIQLYASIGFYEEGCFRDHVFENGGYRNIIFFSMLRNEYMQHGASLPQRGIMEQGA